MDFNDLQNRFGYHPADTEDKKNRHAQIRAACFNLAIHLEDLCGGWESREKSLAITKLEEVMYWANAHVARNS